MTERPGMQSIDVHTPYGVVTAWYERGRAPYPSDTCCTSFRTAHDDRRHTIVWQVPSERWVLVEETAVAAARHGLTEPAATLSAAPPTRWETKRISSMPEGTVHMCVDGEGAHRASLVGEIFEVATNERDARTRLASQLRQLAGRLEETPR